MRLTLLGALVSVLALLGAAGVKAQTTATATIEPEGVIVDGGGAALVFIVVECTLDPGDQLLEGFVTLSQDATSGMGSLNPRCDGKPHRDVVRVQALGGNFRSGDAFASAFLLFLDPETGSTVQAQDSRTITLRGPPAR